MLCIIVHPYLIPHKKHVRQTQAFVLRSGSSSTVVWPRSFIELSLPPEIAPDSSLTIEPRSNVTKASKIWPHPQITEAVSNKIRLFNDSEDPQLVNKPDHFSQVCYMTVPNCTPPDMMTYVPKPFPSQIKGYSLLHYCVC